MAAVIIFLFLLADKVVGGLRQLFGTSRYVAVVCSGDASVVSVRLAWLASVLD